MTTDIAQANALASIDPAQAETIYKAILERKAGACERVGGDARQGRG